MRPPVSNHPDPAADPVRPSSTARLDGHADGLLVSARRILAPAAGVEKPPPSTVNDVRSAYLCLVTIPLSQNCVSFRPRHTLSMVAKRR